MPAAPLQPLYRRQELAFCAHYAELKERSRSEGTLLPGTPGHLTLRDGTGYRYWYRRYYAVPGLEVEDLVCKDGEDAKLQELRERIEFSEWAMRQVRSLRQWKFQVADKDVARVLVELHNHRHLQCGPGHGRYAGLHGMAQRVGCRGRQPAHTGH